MILNRQGLTFQILREQQTKFESIFRTNGLNNANQKQFIENVTTGVLTQISGSEIGIEQAEIITTCSCLLLQPGIYKWLQEITSNSVPIFLTHEYGTAFVTNFPNFGVGGGSPFEFVNTGTNNISTHMSSIGGRRIYARGKIIYDLENGEELFAEVRVINTTTGAVIGTGETTAEGQKTGEVLTGIVPYITQQGHIYRIELNIQTNSLKKQKCLLVQHG
ncbi:hypothetical protein [Chryseobacterium gambrini]|uniref:hypothetical protein n=1 Tax=Chryseobacterium gambrini TaxID=373672 RepID=UPI003D0A4030